MQFIIEVHFKNGKYARICNNIRDLCQEIRSADNSGIAIDLIRAVKYQPKISIVSQPVAHLQRIEL